MMFIVMTMFLTFEAYGRCSARSADFILNKAMDCGTGKDVSLYDLKNLPSEAEMGVINTCSSGCYVMNSREKEDCEQRYAANLLVAKESMQNYADKNNCKLNLGQIEKLAKIDAGGDQPKGCEFVGSYSKKIVKPSSGTKCAPAQRNAVLCEAKMHCNPGSEIHEEYDLGSKPEEFKLTCVGDAQGKCPSMWDCINDEGYKTYEGGDVVKRLPDEGKSETEAK